MSIGLFSVTLRAGLREPPIRLICQCLDVAGEKLLWVDGVNPQDPVLIPLSACPKSRWLGTFRDYAGINLDLTRQVIEASQGDDSPSVIVRAVECMTADPSLTAEMALEMTREQGLDLFEADNLSGQQFWGSEPLGQAAGLAAA